VSRGDPGALLTPTKDRLETRARGTIVPITAEECAALVRVETEVLPALAAITDEQLENRAMALDTKQKAQQAQRDIAPALQVCTQPQRLHQEPEMTDGDALRRANAAREALLAIERRASSRLYRLDP